MKPYFEELKISQFFSAKISSIALDPQTTWQDYFNFVATSIPTEYLFGDQFYHWLYKKHPYKAGLLKMDDKSIYNWHTDTNRGVCINCMLPTPNTSYTFFRLKYKPGVNITQHKLIELQYYPGVRYLFNNQQQHMVINYDGLRFMLTLEFEKNKNELSFEQLSSEINELYYVR